MAGDNEPTAVATAFITAPGAGQTTIANVTFFTAPTQTGVLLFNAPGEDKLTGTLFPFEWQKAYSWYFWKATQRQIFWATASGTDQFTNLPVAVTEPSSRNTVQATSTSSNSQQTLTTQASLTGTVSHSPVATTGSLESVATTGSLESVATTGSLESVATTGSLQPTATAALSQKTKSSSNVSAGGAAGIAIGCLLAGALIAGLIAWFCLGRLKSRHKHKDQEASTVAFLPREKQASTKVQSIESDSPISQVMAYSLPQPLEDKAISKEISKLENLIKNHVQSFYHSGRVSPGLLDLDDLQALGTDLPISAGTLSTLLGNANTREIALRFCVAWVVVTRLQPHSDPRTTFLPPEVAQCVRSMSVADQGSKAFILGKWRALTAELMQSTYVRSAFTPSDPRTHNVRNALDALDAILQPFADSRMDNGQRRQNLEEILKRAASFAFTLFAQPSSWKFDWQDEQGVKSSSLCIFPALVQVADESGEALGSPRRFSEAVVRELDG